MPKFEFSLDAVLQQREWRERECQRQLGVLLGRMGELEAQLRQLDDAVKQSTDDLRDGHLTGRIDLAFLAAHRRFVLASQRRGREVMQRMVLLTRQVDEARAVLVEASRARKVVEKLRERRLVEWKAKLLASEQQESDDISSKMTTQVWQDEQRAEAMLAER